MHADSQKTATGWRKSFAALENVEFRWLLTSNAAFFLSLNGQMLTRSFLAWEMTGQEMALAYINCAYAIPMIFFSFVGGVLTDRFERKNLIQVSQIALTLGELAILILLIIGKLEFWHLIVAGIAGGIIIPVVMPARTAIVYNIIGASKLGNGMALSMGVLHISRVIGPVIMGWAISQYSATGAYVIATFLFTISYFFLFGVQEKPVHETENGKPEINIFLDIREGLRYILHNKPVFMCLIFGCIPMSLAMPIQNLMILFANDVWQVGERGLGILMAFAGLGGVIGSLWVASRGENSNRVKLMIANAIGFGIFLAIFSMTSNFYIALIPLLIANLCSSASQTLNNTTVQLLADDSQRGRVSSFMMLTFGLTPLGVLPLAFSAQYLGIGLTTSIASFVLIGLVLMLYIASTTLRRMDNHVVNALKAV